MNKYNDIVKNNLYTLSKQHVIIKLKVIQLIKIKDF